jgi:hypothetical protein
MGCPQQRAFTRLSITSAWIGLPNRQSSANSRLAEP